MVLHVAGELVLDDAVFHRDRGRHDEGGSCPSFSHRACITVAKEPQDSSCPLEALQARPVAVEPVEGSGWMG